MGSKSKSELMDIIERQQEKLLKYEKKLRDVISAYKSLLSEKQALEESLLALSGPHVPELTVVDTSVAISSCDQANIPTASSESSFEDAKSELSRNSSSVDVAGFSEQSQLSDNELFLQKISVLQKSLSTLTIEKSRVEAALTADKKLLLSEKESLQQKIQHLEEETKHLRQSLEQQLNEARANVRQLQCERECEQTDHAASIKELQNKLTHERMNGDHARKQVGLLEKEIADARQGNETLEQQISGLKSEMGKLRMNLSDSEAKLKSVPSVTDIQKQLQKVKVECEELCELQRKKAAEAETVSVNLVKQAENRAAELELRISELLQSISNSEQQRQKLTLRSDNLESKLACLENNLSLHLMSDEKSVVLNNVPLESVSHDILKTVIQQLIQSFQSRASHEQVLGFVCSSECLSESATVMLHDACKSELNELKDDFDRYKYKMQMLGSKSRSVTPDTCSKETAKENELEQLKSVVDLLQSKVDQFETEQRKTAEAHNKTVESLQKLVTDTEEQTKTDLKELEAAKDQHLAEIEGQLTKQRERTLHLLADKDSEINYLKTLLGRSSSASGNLVLGSPQLDRKPVPTPPGIPRNSRIGFPSVSEETFPETVSRTRQRRPLSRNSADAYPGYSNTPPPCVDLPSDSLSDQGSVIGGSFENAGVVPSGNWFPPDPGSSTSLYYSQELARKDKELLNLRRARRELDESMRQVQHSAVAKELQLFNTIEALKDQIRSLESRLSRADMASPEADPSHLEYLKNVLVQYILCEKPDGKKHMLKAISAALKLTHKEVDLILKHNETWYSTWLRTRK